MHPKCVALHPVRDTCWRNLPGEFGCVMFSLTVSLLPSGRRQQWAGGLQLAVFLEKNLDL